MSARSFGTFIDSEPSTPAYSPRTGSSWDGSTLVLLSPVSSAASSPTEPAWQMMKPPKRMTRHKPQPSLKKEISLGAAMSGTPVVPAIREEEATPEKKEKQDTLSEDEKENAPNEKQPETTDQEKTLSQPLERLTTRMKSLLRQRSETNAKRRAEKMEKKQKRYLELDRVETTHWTEL